MSAKRPRKARELVDIYAKPPPAWPFPFSSRGWHLREPPVLAQVGAKEARKEKGRG